MLKRFDRKFKALLETLNIEIDLYKRYVDDLTKALAPLAPGVRFVEEDMKMVRMPELEESDSEECDDKRTFEELRKIANTIYQCVQFTTDTPSSHEEEMCPVLDLQVAIGVDGLICYKFFSKPCASKFVIPEKSAHSKQMKMAVLVEEGLRRMRNCSRGMEWSDRRVVMVEWAKKLRRNGYSATIRHQVVKEAILKYEKMCAVEDEGGRPVHRGQGDKNCQLA